MITSPVIVKLKGKSEIGEGILISVETIIEPAKDEKDQIIRDSNGNLTMVKRRECLVCWQEDKSQIYPHDLEELEWVEVVAVRTLDEMKEEVVNEVMDILDESVEDESEPGEAGNEDEVGDGEPEKE